MRLTTQKLCEGMTRKQAHKPHSAVNRSQDRKVIHISIIIVIIFIITLMISIIVIITIIVIVTDTNKIPIYILV